jgi:DNA-binding NtrC family response regulator
MATVLIVDDDEAMRDGLAEAILDFGHRAIAATGGRAALALLEATAVDAILLDLRMPDMDGLELMRQLRGRSPDKVPPIAILTAFASSSNTIEAMRLGAFDHVPKPVGRKELATLIERMVRRPPRNPSPDRREAADGEALVGQSAAMREIQKVIGRVADTGATVLITGETGTGKEVVARAIHRFGRRAAGPFVAVNCAAIPPDLLESELFGHLRGAFTGALSERKGAFRDADTGTLFLDEIGDMPLAMQAKILRALQERSVNPVGGRPAPVDVRIVAATHRDLAARILEGRFREDLYYRINVVPLDLPPLRERPADIVPLAEHFVGELSGGSKRLAADATARLLAYPWPGNVRELRNAIERAMVLCRGTEVGDDELRFLAEWAAAAPVAGQDWLAGDLASAVARLEAAMIDRALREAGGNRAEAARRLGIHRQLLYSKARRYGIAMPEASFGKTPGVVNPDKVAPARPED